MQTKSKLVRLTETEEILIKFLRDMGTSPGRLIKKFQVEQHEEVIKQLYLKEIENIYNDLSISWKKKNDKEVEI